MNSVEFEVNQLYHDRVSNIWLVFQEKDSNGYYWFKEIQDENYNACCRSVCYYEEDLINIV